MDPHKALIASWVVLGFGGVLAAVGMMGVHYFKDLRDTERERAKARSATEEKQLASLPRLHFRSLTVYYVRRGEREYQLCAVAHILNKDAGRACVVQNVAFRGSFNLFGTDSASIALVGITQRDAPPKLPSKYFLPPGGDASIKFELPQAIEMFIEGPGTPGIAFSGSWVITVEDTSFELPPADVRVEKILSADEWSEL
jgi:hypothetical protein